MFMDFFERFIQDKDYQLAHVNFPAQVNNEEITTAANWKYLSVPYPDGYMPILQCDTLTYYEKDIAKSELGVSILSFASKKATACHFTKSGEAWKCTGLTTNSIDQAPDIEFIRFLQEFSSDPAFQVNHIYFPLPNYYLDTRNDYQTVFDSLKRPNWKHINLIQDLENLIILDVDTFNTNYRLIFYRGIGTGIYLKFTFKRDNDTWQLIKKEDYST